jgi:hypothetical protein
MSANSILPRRPLLSSFVSKLRAKVPKLHIGTNPCRIKFYGQEIVVFREDIMARMLRNLVGVKPDVRTDDLKRYVGYFPRNEISILLSPFLAASSIYSRSKSSNATDYQHTTYSL